MHAAPDPYAILGVARGATDRAIHAGYRAAVRRTHPDAGGSAAQFEAVQEAYELLRDPRRRRAWDDGHPGPRASATAGGARRTEPDARAAPDAHAAQRAMDDLLAESQRLEDEARDLAGRTRGRRPGSAGDDDAAQEGSQDSMSAVLRDAGRQLSTVAAEWSRELSRILRRMG